MPSILLALNKCEHFHSLICKIKIIKPDMPLLEDSGSQTLMYKESLGAPVQNAKIYALYPHSLG